MRGLKLLDRLLRMCGIAIEAGLVPWEAGDAIVERFAADADPPRPLDRLFALSDFRQAAGHRKEDVKGVVAAALGRFDIDLAATKGGWGLPLDQIYDQLADQLREIHATLIGVLRIGLEGAGAGP